MLRTAISQVPKEAIEPSIPEQFEEMVRLYPEQLAVKTHHDTCTYAESIA